MLLQRGPQWGPTRAYQTLAALGDSHTFAASGLGLENYYPALLQSRLRGTGHWVTIVNLGSSGFTTGQVLNRINSSTTPYARPSTVGLLYAGTNDFGSGHIGIVQADPAPTETTFTVDEGLGDEFFAGSHILVDGVAAIVESVSGDDITLTEALPAPPVADDEVQNDTEANLVACGNALIAKGYTKLFVGVQHYLNFSAGGDTLETPSPSLAAMRAAQNAAATTLGANAVLADFYNFMRDRIVAGTDVQGDFAWHTADGNTHLNEYGQEILMECIDEAFTDVWLDSLV